MQTSRSRILGLAAAGFVAIPLLAQGQPPVQPERPAEQPRTAEPPARPATATETTVTLSDAGQEPRRAVRYQLAEDFKQKADVRMEMSSKVAMNGTPMPSPDMPPLDIKMEFKVTDANNGVHEVQGELVEAQLRNGEDPAPDDMAQMLNEAFEQMAGLKTISQVDDRGIIRSSRVESPAGVDPRFAMVAGELERPMTQIGIQFPEEEIGEGARWVVVIPTINQGVRIDHIIEYELTSLNDEIAEVQMVLSQSADPQPMANGAELRSMTGEGKGSAKVDLRRPAALESEAEMTSHLHLVMSEMGEEQEVIQTITLKTKLESEDTE